MAEITTIDSKDAGKVGRPCKYESHVEPRLDEIEQWIKDGLTDYCIADNLGIHQNTLIRYRDNYINLRDTYTRAQIKQVQTVVNSVFKRANGYNYEEQTLESFAIKDEEGNVIGHELKPTKVVTKHIPGDVNAQKFYLVNRDSEHWQSENKVEYTNNTINNFQLPEAHQKVEQLLTEREKLRAVDVTGLEVVEVD